jgi:hypothetical protein
MGSRAPVRIENEVRRAALTGAALLFGEPGLKPLSRRGIEGAEAPS